MGEQAGVRSEASVADRLQPANFTFFIGAPPSATRQPSAEWNRVLSEATPGSGGQAQWSKPGGHNFGHLFGAKHEIAWWIILSCHAAMALGTMAGGWRIVQTVGSRITPHLRPVGGFSAELAAATTIGMATMAHVPISTTHAIGGAVSGVGATRGWHAVRWIWGKRIVYAWVLTFPGAALIGAGAYLLSRWGIQPFIK